MEAPGDAAAAAASCSTPAASAGADGAGDIAPSGSYSSSASAAAAGADGASDPTPSSSSSAGAADPLPPSTGDPFARTMVTDVAFREVWRGNYIEEFGEILEVVRRRPGRLYIAVHFEFCGAKYVNPKYRPQRPSDWYWHLSRFVHTGDVLQMGLALAFEPAEPLVVWDVNFSFDEDSRERDYHPNTLAFLKDHGHDLARHRDAGVLPEVVSAALLRHLRFGDPDVTWITYHGDKDVAFLLKLLKRSGPLPLDRADFLDRVRDMMPTLYDVKVLAQLVDPRYRSGLQGLAGMLEVQRVGPQHHASSDALLCLSCFATLRGLRGGATRLLCRRGLLSGLEQLHPALHAQPLSVVELTAGNFNSLATRVSDLLHSNFSVIFMDVNLPGMVPPSEFSSDAQREYELMRSALMERAENTAEITLGFANAEGRLGWGTLWKISLDLTAGASAPATQFWALMAECGGIHDPGTIWLTCHGGYGVAWLLSSFLSPEPLPTKRSDYVKLRAALLPSLYDIGLIAYWCKDVKFRTPGCKGGLLDLVRSLMVEGAEDLENLATADPVLRAILVFKCFCKLSVLSDFNRVAKSVRGKAMSACCWTCTPSTR